jgi:hypothetical protein
MLEEGFRSLFSGNVDVTSGDRSAYAQDARLRVRFQESQAESHRRLSNRQPWDI